MSIAWFWPTFNLDGTIGKNALFVCLFLNILGVDRALVKQHSGYAQFQVHRELLFFRVLCCAEEVLLQTYRISPDQSISCILCSQKDQNIYLYACYFLQARQLFLIGAFNETQGSLMYEVFLDFNRESYASLDLVFERMTKASLIFLKAEGQMSGEIFRPNYVQALLIQSKVALGYNPNSLQQLFGSESISGQIEAVENQALLGLAILRQVFLINLANIDGFLCFDYDY